MTDTLYTVRTCGSIRNWTDRWIHEPPEKRLKLFRAELVDRRNTIDKLRLVWGAIEAYYEWDPSHFRKDPKLINYLIVIADRLGKIRLV